LFGGLGEAWCGKCIGHAAFAADYRQKYPGKLQIIESNRPGNSWLSVRGSFNQPAINLWFCCRGCRVRESDEAISPSINTHDVLISKLIWQEAYCLTPATKLVTDKVIVVC